VTREEGTVALRAIRGATRLSADDPGEMTAAVTELVTAMLERNGIPGGDELISIVFTATPDLVCMFPAAAARGLGLGDVPLLCAQEIAVPGSLSRVVRVLAHADLEVSRAEVVHVYLRGAEVLRQDLAQ
jgi:chorismate mutase